MMAMLGNGGLGGLGNALGGADMGEMMAKAGGPGGGLPGGLPGLGGPGEMPKLPPGFENFLKKK
jgi:signal recognition particle subunit SRP54